MCGEVEREYNDDTWKRKLIPVKPAAFPSPADILKKAGEKLKPEIEKCRQSLISEMEAKCWGETGFIVSYNPSRAWDKVIEEARSAGWDIKITSERGESYLSIKPAHPMRKD